MAGGYVKRTFRGATEALARALTRSKALGEARHTDMYLAALLSRVDRMERLNDPCFFVRQLHECFLPERRKVVEIKRQHEACAEHDASFSRLLGAIERNLPGLPAEVALQVVFAADDYLGDHSLVAAKPGDRLDFLTEADVAWTLGLGSSLAKRGRLLYNIVRFLRPRVCVEAGTFFGMSALYIAHALGRLGEGGSLHTIEPVDTFHAKASFLLSSTYPDTVTCHKGTSVQVLPSLTERLPGIDLFFHDAEHTGAAYVRDFRLVVDALHPGSVVVFDDIRWGESGKAEGEHQCYRGWREVVATPRVCRAAEMGKEMGIALIA